MTNPLIQLHRLPHPLIDVTHATRKPPTPHYRVVQAHAEPRPILVPVTQTSGLHRLQSAAGLLAGYSGPVLIDCALFAEGFPKCPADRFRMARYNGVSFELLPAGIAPDVHPDTYTALRNDYRAHPEGVRQSKYDTFSRMLFLA